MRSDQLHPSFLVESGHGALQRNENARPGDTGDMVTSRPQIPLAPPTHDVEREPSNKKPDRNWPQAVCLLLGGYALVGGLISFAGWFADIPALTDWEGRGVSIQPLTTVAAILSGGAAIMLAFRIPMIAGSLGVLIGLIGLSSIVQTAASLDLGIDTMVMFGREWGRTGVTSPGRMGIPGSISWTVIGAAVLCASIGQRSKYANRRGIANDTAVTLAVVGIAISMLSLIGFLHRAEALYTLPRLTIIAVQTSTFIFATSLAILVSLRSEGPMSLFTETGPGGTLVRRIMPAVILIPIALGLLMLAGVTAGYYDTAFGVAIRTLLEIGFLLALLVWTARAVNRQAQRAEETQRDLALLADAMPQVVWIAGPDGRVSYYNAQVAGFGGGEQYGDRADGWTPTIHPEDAAEAAECWEAALASRLPFGNEHRIQMADGSYRWHLSRAFPVLASDGGVEKWYGTTTDIHDLKLAEEVLRESEQRFARFMHHLPGLAWIKDSSGRYVYANDAAMRAFKMSKALYGRTDAEIFSSEVAAAFSANDRKALESGTGIQVIEQLEDETGVIRHSLVSKFPIPLSAGTEPMIGGMAIDITEQRQAEAVREFLFGITERIRTAEDPEELLARVSTAVGEYLGVHRCLFNSIDLETDVEIVHTDYARDGASVAGRHKISAYSSLTSEEMSRGYTVVNNDAARDERTAALYDEVYGPNNERAYVAVPMLRDGTWVASLWCSDDRPRKWADHEIELLENIAERTWLAVERLRANTLLEERVERRTQELAEVNEQLRTQMEERSRIEDQRVRLLKKLFTIQEDERGRIARDIHDQLGQRLTALRLKIAAVKDLCAADPLLSQRVTRLQEISELLDSEVSFLAWELRPSILNETDLDSALEQYVREWSRFSGIFAECDRVGLVGVQVDSEIATNLYRITQEALNNVAKYSQAEVANVLLEKRGSDLILIIEDNGVGFDLASLSENGDERGGFGLVGMRERASIVSGTFEIESAPGQGTTIFVRVPLDSRGGYKDGN